MKRLLLLILLTFDAGCMNADYKFERLDGDRSTELPLKLDGFHGQRDGAMVNVEARFVDGADRVTMDIEIFLRPPAEFRSGNYQATVGGQTISGTVDCPSLTFLGGQTALPNVGGLFLMKDAQNRPIYRVRIPSTMLMRVTTTK